MPGMFSFGTFINANESPNKHQTVSQMRCHFGEEKPTRKATHGLEILILDLLIMDCAMSDMAFGSLRHRKLHMVHLKSEIAFWNTDLK